MREKSSEEKKTEEGKDEVMRGKIINNETIELKIDKIIVKLKRKIIKERKLTIYVREN